MIAGLASVELLDSCKNAEATDAKSEALAEGCVTSDIASDIVCKSRIGLKIYL